MDERREAVTIPSVGRSDVVSTRGELFLPRGQGPFAAVIVIHGCGGVRSNSWAWAGDLARAGYAALVVDHFGPRGINRICEREGGRIVEQRERRVDTFSGLHYLAGRAEIDKNRIGLLGFSHGGMTVLNSLLPGMQDPPDLRFKAGIAIYPECSGYIGLSFTAPVLILAGEKDDWTPASVCQQLVTRLPAGSRPARIETYPNAHHAFDEVGQGYFYVSRAVNPYATSGFGATVEYNRDAHERAKVHVRDYFSQQLGQ